MSTLYEIVELPNGEVALQSIDDGEPLVSIRFSKSSQFFLDEEKVEIAKSMIEAALESAGAISHISETETYLDDDGLDDSVTIH